MSQPSYTHIALIEVDAKQAWIFETSRLRDAVGASYLVTEVERVARDALPQEAQEWNIASGQALALFPSEPAAQDWVGHVTLDFARRAPGMEVSGAVAAWDGRDTFTAGESFKAVFQARDRAREARGGAVMLERGLPWLLPCHYSGAPAVDKENPVHEEHKQGRRVSQSVLNRREVFEKSRARVAAELKKRDWDERLIKRIDDAYSALGDDKKKEPLSDQETWRGILHADGNGLGQIFLNFFDVARQAGCATVDQVRQLHRDFSHEINESAWEALKLALEELNKKIPASWTFPVYLLIVGGDDLTAVTDGRFALGFARNYLNALNEQSKQKPTILRVLKAEHKRKEEEKRKTEQARKSAQGRKAEQERELTKDSESNNMIPDHLDACAGVAIVKHHFPFSQAYDLANRLCDSAKEKLRDVPASGLDWHAVLDASPPTLKELRRLLEVPGPGLKHHLTRRPYALSDFDRLTRAAAQLREEDPDGRPLISNAQLHDLREGLFRGATEGENRLQLSRARDPLRQVLATLHDDKSAPLFKTESPPPKNGKPQPQEMRCGLLDLADHRDLLGGLPAPEAP